MCDIGRAVVRAYGSVIHNDAPETPCQRRKPEGATWMSGGIVFGGGMTEEWRPVVGYEGLYEVSSEGRVRSLAQATRGIGRPRRDMILRNGKWEPMPKGGAGGNVGGGF